MIREICAIELTKMGMHAEAKTYRLANRMKYDTDTDEENKADSPKGCLSGPL